MSSQDREETYTRSNVYQRWEIILERIFYGLEDLSRLYEDLPDEKRREVFKEVAQFYEPSVLKQDLAEAFGFILLGIIEQVDHELYDEDFYGDVFEAAIRRALERVSMGADDVEVDVRIEGVKDLRQVKTEFELPSMDEGVLRSMLNTGEITPEEYAKAVLAKEAEA